MTRVNREFSDTVKAAIDERAGWRCEICRVKPIGCYHHRLRRSQSGMGVLDNGLGLCEGPGSCHAWVHANPERSYELGYLLHPAPVNMGLKVAR